MTLENVAELLRNTAKQVKQKAPQTMAKAGGDQPHTEGILWSRLPTLKVAQAFNR